MIDCVMLLYDYEWLLFGDYNRWCWLGLKVEKMK